MESRDTAVDWKRPGDITVNPQPSTPSLTSRPTRKKLIRPCGYRGSGNRQTIGKRAGSPGPKRSLWSRIVEVSSKKEHSQNILFKALSFVRANLLSESLKDEATGRTRRDVVERNIITLELRNRINDVQFIIIQHLLLEVR